MSQNSLTEDLIEAAQKVRGKQGYHTNRGRKQSLARLASFLWQRGYQLHRTSQLKEKHIMAWVEEMKARGCSKRTVANNMAHVRTALEGIKRRPFADKLSNASLDVSRSSRMGAKEPMSAERFAVFLSAVASLDTGVAMVLELQLQFGLRAEEGVRSVKSLPDWERTLLNTLSDGFVTILYGTKGGRTRRSPPLDRQQALDLVQRAMRLAKTRGGKLVLKPDLAKAMNRYHYVVGKAGLRGKDAPHSLRYSYTHTHLSQLAETGVSTDEAAAAVSTWLGHGDGRGTWVRSVYGRTALVDGRARSEVQVAEGSTIGY